MNTEQLQKMATAPGFIAALDQSGGSTPKALRLYGLEESTYSGEAEMFDLIHQMRTRIMTSSAFTGERILGAILFEMTMERQVEGMGAAEYLSLIHISEPTRRTPISYAVFCLKKKKKKPIYKNN